MLEASCALEDSVYNLTRPLKSLRVEIENEQRCWVPRSPAMAAGLTDHIWTIRELIMKNMFIKIIGIIAFIFIILALGIITRIPSANGYEISIYDEYPWFFWYILISAIACGIGILVNQAFAMNKSVWWPIGICLFVLPNLIIILMPIFRNYFISDLSDEVHHLAMIKDIAITSYTGNLDIYPISHILAYQISSLCRLDYRITIKILPSIFYLIYVVGLFLLAKQICKNLGKALLIMAFSSVLLFTYYQFLFLPTQFFLALVPFALFLFFRKNDSSSSNHAILLIIFLLLMPFTHPLGSIFLVVIFLLFALANLICYFMAKRNIIECESALHSPLAALNSGSILLIIFVMWFINFGLFHTTVNQAYQWFVHGYGIPAMETYRTNYSDSDITILQLVDLIIRNYGHNFIFIFLSSAAICAILRKAFRQNNPIKTEEIFFPLIFLFFSFFYAISLFGNFIMTGGTQRILCWALMASTVTNGISYYEWFYKLKNRKAIIYISFLAIIITISTIIGVFSTYPSLQTMHSGFQVTAADMDGMQWFFDNKNADNTMCFSPFPYNSKNFIYGFSTPKPKAVGLFYLAPPRLGYDKNDSLAYSINLNSYMMIGAATISTKEHFFPDKGRFTLDDLTRIDFDLGINKIYSNQGLNIYHIVALGNNLTKK